MAHDLYTKSHVVHMKKQTWIIDSLKKEISDYPQENLILSLVKMRMKFTSKYPPLLHVLRKCFQNTMNLLMIYSSGKLLKFSECVERKRESGEVVFDTNANNQTDVLSSARDPNTAHLITRSI